ncbi:MAG TPA: HIT domain-containing protein [Candidatus Glassbacteria bacterium]|nr:HIT domain-containing protein [Candidatus Glassbacteria bacterium]
MKIDRHLVIPGKLAYVRGGKPDVPCILCSIRDRDEKVVRLEIARTAQMLISLNLYPYNPGHLLIFPLRHITDIRELTKEEVLEMHRLQTRMMEILEEVYGPRGFNIGYNVGAFSGASIEHLHCHLVPRHRNEIGLLEMISEGSRVLVEDPGDTLEKIRRACASKGDFNL